VDVANNPNGSGNDFMVDDDSLLPGEAGQGGSTQAPVAQCLGETRAAEAIGLDIFVMLDISASMLETLPQSRLAPPTKWDAVRQSIQSFVQAPETAEIGIGIQYFPQRVEGVPDQCTSNAECGPGGPCGNSVCLAPAAFDLGANVDPLTFETLSPDVEDATCSTTADCAGPGFNCRTVTGVCGILPGTVDDVEDGLFYPFDAFCNDDQQCDGLLPGTECLPLGVCQVSGLACPVGVECPAGEGTCVPFPPFGCTNQTRCEAAVYAEPAVEISTAPTRTAEIVRSLNDQIPNGLTPTGPALAGALDHARQWAEQNPGRQVVTVLATDGLPTECTPLDVPGIAQIARDASTDAQPLRTFVIGVFSATDLGADGQATLDTLAQAGGTGGAIVINTAGNVADDFLNALNVIRDTAVSCEFKLDGNAALDFDQVNLRVTDPDGAQTQLFNVGDVSACGDDDQGWYYVRDVDGNPRQINVCPETCSNFTTGGVTANLEIGCATLIR
jgi:hypothetical protein